MIKIKQVTEKKENSNKLSVDIFVPLDACACMYESFINRVFNVLMEYMRHIEFQTKSLNSDEAKKMGLSGNCVVLDGNKIVSNTFLLKKEIPKLLKEKGII
ncbi:MAG: hypothetical protein ACTSR3_21950 [Candidatus Helarchaeota archaeon]